MLLMESCRGSWSSDRPNSWYTGDDLGSVNTQEQVSHNRNDRPKTRFTFTYNKVCSVVSEIAAGLVRRVLLLAWADKSESDGERDEC